MQDWQKQSVWTMLRSMRIAIGNHYLPKRDSTALVWYSETMGWLAGRARAGWHNGETQSSQKEPTTHPSPSAAQRPWSVPPKVSHALGEGVVAGLPQVPPLLGGAKREGEWRGSWLEIELDKHDA